MTRAGEAALRSLKIEARRKPKPPGPVGLPPRGLLEPGNIDISKQPNVQNPDGTTSNVRSISAGFDGAEVLLPTVSLDGRIMPDEEAIQAYRDTGRHLGKFDSVESANAAGNQIHLQQAEAVRLKAEGAAGPRSRVRLGPHGVLSPMSVSEAGAAAIRSLQGQAEGKIPGASAAVIGDPGAGPMAMVQDLPTPIWTPERGSIADVGGRGVRSAIRGLIGDNATMTAGALDWMTQPDEVPPEVSAEIERKYPSGVPQGVLGPAPARGKSPLHREFWEPVAKEAAAKLRGIGQAIHAEFPADQEYAGGIDTNPWLLADPLWWVENVPSTFGQSAAFFIPGSLGAGAAGVAAKSLGMAPKAVKLLQFLGASLAGADSESRMEAGAVWDEALEEGLSREEAAKRASTTYALNFPLIAASGGLGYYSKYIPGMENLVEKVPGAIRRLFTAFLEGGQEVSQEYVSAGVMGRKPQQPWTQFVLGATVGGVMGGGGGAAESAEIADADLVAAMDELEQAVKDVDEANKTRPEGAKMTGPDGQTWVWTGRGVWELDEAAKGKGAKKPAKGQEAPKEPAGAPTEAAPPAGVDLARLTDDLKAIPDGAEKEAILGHLRAGEIEKAQERIAKALKAQAKPVTPVPETQETIDAQFKAMKEGRKPAVLTTPGGPGPRALPAGSIAAPTVNHGTLHFPPGTDVDSIIGPSPAGGIRSLTEEQIAKALGYPGPKPAEGDPFVVVTGRTAEGHEAVSMVVAPDQLDAAKAVALKQAGKGGTVEVGGEGQVKTVLDERRKGGDRGKGQFKENIDQRYSIMRDLFGEKADEYDRLRTRYQNMPENDEKLALGERLNAMEAGKPQAKLDALVATYRPDKVGEPEEPADEGPKAGPTLEIPDEVVEYIPRLVNGLGDTRVEGGTITFSSEQDKEDAADRLMDVLEEIEAERDSTDGKASARIDAFKDYAGKVIASGPIQRVSMIGSQAQAGEGRDVDLLYDLGDQDLPEDSGEAAAAVEVLLGDAVNLDLDMADSFFKVGDRYFYLAKGAGQGLVENTEYAKEQAGKPQTLLSGEAPTTEAAPAAAPPVDGHTPEATAIFGELKSRLAGNGADNHRKIGKLKDKLVKMGYAEDSVEEWERSGYEMGENMPMLEGPWEEIQSAARRDRIQAPPDLDALRTPTPLQVINAQRGPKMTKKALYKRGEQAVYVTSDIPGLSNGHVWIRRSAVPKGFREAFAEKDGASVPIQTIHSMNAEGAIPLDAVATLAPGRITNRDANQVEIVVLRSKDGEIELFVNKTYYLYLAKAIEGGEIVALKAKGEAAKSTEHILGVRRGDLISAISMPMRPADISGEDITAALEERAKPASTSPTAADVTRKPSKQGAQDLIDAARKQGEEARGDESAPTVLPVTVIESPGLAWRTKYREWVEGGKKGYAPAPPKGYKDRAADQARAEIEAEVVEAQGAAPFKKVVAGNRVRFTPKKKTDRVIEGIVRDPIKSTTGAVGYEIYAGKDLGVVRVWDADGTLEVLTGPTEIDRAMERAIDAGVSAMERVGEGILRKLGFIHQGGESLRDAFLRYTKNRTAEALKKKDLFPRVFTDSSVGPDLSDAIRDYLAADKMEGARTAPGPTQKPVTPQIEAPAGSTVLGIQDKAEIEAEAKPDPVESARAALAKAMESTEDHNPANWFWLGEKTVGPAIGIGDFHALKGLDHVYGGEFEDAEKNYYSRHTDVETGGRLMHRSGPATEAAGRKGPPKKVEIPADVADVALSDKDRAEVEELKAKIKRRMEDLAKGSTPGVGLPLDLLLDMVKMGTIYVRNGLTQAGKWTAKMVSDLGESVRQYLGAVWRRIKKKNPDLAATMTDTEVTGGTGTQQPGPADTGSLEGAPTDDVGGAQAEGGADQDSEGSPGAAGGPAVVPPTRKGPRSSGSGGTGKGGVAAPPGGRGAGPAAEPGPADDEADAIIEKSRGPQDYVITDEDALGEGGGKSKAAGNIRALRLLKEIEDAGRPATKEEQAVLVKYVGWGGLKNAFNESSQAWGETYNALTDLLTVEEFAAARASTMNAHYTSPVVIKGMWAAVRRLGVGLGGRFLEPAFGIGHFYGLMPGDYAKSKRSAVEKDSVTARIAALLYPNAHPEHSPYERFSQPDDFYDLMIGNIPFGDIRIHDPKFKRTPFILARIHNYFFAKALKGVKPGGIVAFVTSAGTMDSLGNEHRAYLAKHARFLGAIRLPDTAFKRNAGTEVVTDIIFLQKREPVATAEDLIALLVKESKTFEPWLESRETAGKGGDRVTINEYYIAHPEMMLGEMSLGGSMYREGSQTLEGELTPEALAEAVNRLPKGVVWDVKKQQATINQDEYLESWQVPDADAVNEGGYHVSTDGRVVVKEKGKFVVPGSMGKETARRIKGMLAVRSALRQVFRTQLDNASTDKEIEAARKALNVEYDKFVKKYGAISSKKNSRAMGGDPTAPMLQAVLEDYDSKTDTATKRKIFTERTIQSHKFVERVDTAHEALIVSLNELGRVDMDRMSQLTGMSEALLLAELDGYIFRSPEGPIESADEYLSGNVREKLKVARTAASTDPKFQTNVDALEKVQPQDLTPEDVTARLGAPWVTREDMVDFVSTLSGIGAKFITVGRNEHTAKWTVKIKGAGLNQQDSLGNIDTWGTARVPAIKIIQFALNQQQITVRERDRDGTTYIDWTATENARAKMEAVKEEFPKWMWQDKDRSERVLHTYNEVENAYTRREFDGSHLAKEEGLPGMNPYIKGILRPHQLNAIYRAIATGRFLLDHPVGSGKTYIMIAAAMEMKRLGLIRKAIFNVPGHKPTDFLNDTLLMYPHAKVLMVTTNDMNPDNRKRFMAKVASGDYDIVITTLDQFKKIPLSRATTVMFINEELEEMRIALAAAREDGDRRTIAQIERAIANMEARLENLNNEEDKDKGSVTFEEMGLDMIIVDEAHKHKGLPFQTSLQIPGIKVQSSQRAFDLYQKAQWLQRRNGGRGLGMATATPLSNSISELWIMMRYLMEDVLRDRGYRTFDAWVGAYGETRTEMESLPEGGGHRYKERFANFVNWPELMQMYHMVADVKTKDELQIPVPAIKGGEPEIVMAPEYPAILDFIQNVLKPRAEHIRADPRGALPDNMLSVVTAGRKAAMDFRMIDPAHPDSPHSKVNLAVERIFALWESTKADRGTQFIFQDLSSPQLRPSERDLAGKDHPFNDPNVRGKFKDKDGKQIPPEVVKGHARDMSLQDIQGNLAAALSHKTDEEASTRKLAREMERMWSEVLRLHILARDGPKGEHFTSIPEDMRKKLIAKGVPSEEIAFMQDLNKPADKEETFNRVRSGEIRILFGSSQKGGEGTNVQDRMISLVEIDSPWKPNDVEQRQGRVVRQGNLWGRARSEGGLEAPIHHLRLVQEGSFDEYMWGTVMRKAPIVGQERRADMHTRVQEDLSGLALSAAEAMAIASGNPLAIEKVEVDVKVRKLQMEANAHAASQGKLRQVLATHPEEIAAKERKLAAEEADLKKWGEEKGDEAVEITFLGKTYSGKDAYTELGASDLFEWFEGGKWRAWVEKQGITAPSFGSAPLVVGSVRGFDILVIGEEGGYIGLDAASAGSLKEGSFVKLPVLSLRDSEVTSFSSGSSFAEGGAFHNLYHNLGSPETRARSIMAIVPNQARSRIAALNEDLKKLRNDLKTAEEKANKPYPKQDELNHLEARKKIIDQTLDVNHSDDDSDDTDDGGHSGGTGTPSRPGGRPVMNRGGGPTPSRPSSGPVGREFETGPSVDGDASDPRSSMLTDGEQERVDDLKKEIQDRTRALMSTTGSTLIPLGLAAKMAELGTIYVRAGVRTFGSWSRKMIADLGESVRPHLKGIWRNIRKANPDLAKTMDDEDLRVPPEAAPGPFAPESSIMAESFSGVPFPDVLGGIPNEIKASLVTKRGRYRLSLGDARGNAAYYRELHHEAEQELMRAAMAVEVGKQYTFPAMWDKLARIPTITPYKAAILSKVARSLPFVGGKFGITPAQREEVFDAAEGIKELDEGGDPVFGTKIYEQNEEGDIEERWRHDPATAKAAFEKLSPLAQQATLWWVVERSVLARTFDVTESIEGYMHHFWEGGFFGGMKRLILRRITAPERRKRKEALGYIKDAERAMMKYMIDLNQEALFNQFITDLAAMITLPVSDDVPLKKGWTKIGKLQANRAGRIIGQIAGGRQIPAGMYDDFVRYSEATKEASQAVEALRDMGRLMKGNLIMHPGTAQRNLRSGAIQYATGAFENIYKGMIEGDRRRVASWVAAPLLAIVPSNMEALPAQLWGARAGISSEFGRPNQATTAIGGISRTLMKFMAIPLSLFQAYENYWKRALVIAEAKSRGVPLLAQEIMDLDTAFAATMEAVDNWGFTYSNTPKAIEALRGHGATKTSALAPHGVPFATYWYKRWQMYGRYAAAYSPWVKMSKSDRVARMLTAATMLTLTGTASKGLIGYALGKIRGDDDDEEQVPEMDGAPWKIDRKGRMFVGTDDEGNQLYYRHRDDPWFDIYELMNGAGRWMLEGKAWDPTDVAGEFISEGPLWQGLDVFRGKTDAFDRYKPIGVRLAKVLAPYIVGSRMAYDVRKMTDEYVTKEQTFGETIARHLPFPVEWTGLSTGKIITETVTYRDWNTGKDVKGKREILTDPTIEQMKFWLGVNIKRIRKSDWDRSKFNRGVYWLRKADNAKTDDETLHALKKLKDLDPERYGPAYERVKKGRVILPNGLLDRKKKPPG